MGNLGDDEDEKELSSTWHTSVLSVRDVMYEGPMGLVKAPSIGCLSLETQPPGQPCILPGKAKNTNCVTVLDSRSSSFKSK